MPQSLTTTFLAPLFLRLATNGRPSPELKLERRERSIILNSKEKTFNVEVVVEEEDSLEECLNRFNREVVRTGLLKECKRRRFHENAREKKKRKEREALLLRRRRYHKQKDSSQHDEETPAEKSNELSDFWASSVERFDELVDDNDEIDEDIDSYFQDDGEGTWRFLDGASHT